VNLIFTSIHSRLQPETPLSLQKTYLFFFVFILRAFVVFQTNFRSSSARPNFCCTVTKIAGKKNKLYVKFGRNSWKPQGCLDNSSVKQSNSQSNDESVILILSSIEAHVFADVQKWIGV